MSACPKATYCQFLINSFKNKLYIFLHMHVSTYIYITHIFTEMIVYYHILAPCCFHLTYLGDGHKNTD